jgi:outer membrane protein assembly factor BamA
MAPLIRFARWISYLTAIALIWCLPLFAQAPPTGKSFILGKITVKGSSRFTPEQITAAGGLKRGQQLDLNGIDAAAERISETGAIAQIGYSYSFTGDIIAIEFQITDAARFLPCSYDNFVWFKDADLTDAVRHEVPLYDGSLPVGGEMSAQVSTALEHFLQEHKISGTVAATMTGKLGGPVSGYTLQVSGVSMPVVNIQVSGGPLGLELLGRATRMHLGTDYSRTLESGSGEFGLMEAYRNEGYLQTKFSAGRISLKDPQGVDASAGIIVSYDVSPGPLYNWNGVSWSGNQTLPEGELTKVLQFKIGDIARQDKVNMGWVAVQDAYKNLGYLQIQVEGKPEFDAAQHQVLFHAAIGDNSPLPASPSPWRQN